MASRTFRPGKRWRASRRAVGTPASSVSAVAVSATRKESQTGNQSIVRSELAGQEEPVALHDRAPLRPVHELDEREPQLGPRSEEHTSELQSRLHLVCRLLLEKKKTQKYPHNNSVYKDAVRHHDHA